MTPKLSYNTEMARRIVAMTTGLPIVSDTGLREDTFCLVAISDILQAANCFAEVERELNETHVLNESGHLTAKECVETLQWVLEKTNDPIRLLHILDGEHTLYFLQEDDKTVGLFEDKYIAFFKDFVGKLSARKRVEIAGEAVRLAEDLSEARLDLLYFAREVLEKIKYEPDCPADHRRNLVVGSLETLVNDEERRVSPDLRRVSTKDILFGIDQILGRIPFAPAIRARLDALRKPGDERSDMELLRQALKLVKAVQQP